MPDAPAAPPITPEELERVRASAAAGNGKPLTTEEAQKVLQEDRARRVAAFKADVEAASEKHRVRFDIAVLPFIDAEGRIALERELRIVPL